MQQHLEMCGTRYALSFVEVTSIFTGSPGIVLEVCTSLILTSASLQSSYKYPTFF